MRESGCLSQPIPYFCNSGIGLAGLLIDEQIFLLRIQLLQYSQGTVIQWYSLAKPPNLIERSGWLSIVTFRPNRELYRVCAACAEP